MMYNARGFNAPISGNFIRVIKIVLNKTPAAHIDAPNDVIAIFRSQWKSIVKKLGKFVQLTIHRSVLRAI